MTEEEFITIAKVTKTQGRKGEVAATLFTNFPERFTSRRRLFGLIDAGKNQRQELDLEDHWLHKGQVVLKFAGIDTISQAETLLGWEIQIPRSERAQLESGAVYVSDLVGCTLYDSGRKVGTVQNVQFGSGAAPLLVVAGAGQDETEYLVPFAGDYIEEIALEQKQVKMKLPEGLLELHVPLKKDKRERRNKAD
jgi:16S rRNA processing protein RimM